MSVFTTSWLLHSQKDHFKNSHFLYVLCNQERFQRNMFKYCEQSHFPWISLQTELNLIDRPGGGGCGTARSLCAINNGKWLIRWHGNTQTTCFMTCRPLSLDVSFTHLYLVLFYHSIVKYSKEHWRYSIQFNFNMK